MDLPVDRFGIVRRTAMLRHGHTDDLLKARTRAGDLIHLGHGAYAPAGRLPDGPQREDAVYRLRCIAFATAGRGAAPVLSHQSAAAVHGLPLLKPEHTRVHLLSGQAGRGDRCHQRHIHPGVATDAVVVDAVRVTTLERTAIDVACAAEFAQALTALDGALRLGATLEHSNTPMRARSRSGNRGAARSSSWPTYRPRSCRCPTGARRAPRAPTSRGADASSASDAPSIWVRTVGFGRHRRSRTTGRPETGGVNGN